MASTVKPITDDKPSECKHEWSVVNSNYGALINSIRHCSKCSKSETFSVTESQKDTDKCDTIRIDRKVAEEWRIRSTHVGDIAMYDKDIGMLCELRQILTNKGNVCKLHRG